MTDEPIAHTKDGRPLYDNTPTVVALIVPSLEILPRRILCVLRGNEPGKNLLGLPGGYHMRGESWQEAGCREVFEETGYKCNPKIIRLFQEPVTDEYGNNLLIGESSVPLYYDDSHTRPEEIKQVVWMTEKGLYEKEWAFPLHYKAAYEYFNGKKKLRIDEKIKDASSL